MYLPAFMHATVWLVNNRASEAAGRERVGARCPRYFNYTVCMNHHITISNVLCSRTRKQLWNSNKNFPWIQLRLSFHVNLFNQIYYSFVFYPAPALKSFMLRKAQCCHGLRVHNDFANAVGSCSLNLLTKRGCIEHR